MKRLFLEAHRQGYSPEQIDETMTVGELIEYLSQYDDEIPIYLTHDNRYTYGGITWDLFDMEEYDGNEE